MLYYVNIKVPNKFAAAVGADVNKVLTSARDILNAFLETRERFMVILRRQVQSEEKMASFAKICDTMHEEAQKKRIVLRKLERQHINNKSKSVRGSLKRERKLVEIRLFLFLLLYSLCSALYVIFFLVMNLFF
jgi:hypothetical protein